MDYGSKVQYLEDDVYMVPCRLVNKTWVPIPKPGNNKKTSWTKKEDQFLQELVDQLGFNDWKKVAQKLNKSFHNKHCVVRSAKQVRERWNVHLNPQLNKGPWTQEEDRTIQDSVKLFGRKWSKIAKLMPHRNEHSVKNRYNKICKNRELPSSWSTNASNTQTIMPGQMLTLPVDHTGTTPLSPLISIMYGPDGSPSKFCLSPMTPGNPYNYSFSAFSDKIELPK